jgi:uncharacterized protein YjdB
VVAIAICLAVSTMITGCDLFEEEPDDSVAVTGVSLDKTSLTLAVNAKETLTVTVTPDDATDKSVSWSTNNAQVAAVNNGEVTAVSAGSAVITVTTAGGGKTATCAVTVTAQSSVTDILMAVPVQAAVGIPLTLNGTAIPATAPNKTIVWTVKSGSATISGNTLNATGEGNVVVTATVANGIEQGRNYVKDFTVPVLYTVKNITGATVTTRPATTSGDTKAFGTHQLPVTVASFKMGETEVTWQLYKAVYDWAVTKGYTFSGTGKGEGNNYPVSYVNWRDAVVWCNAYSEAMGLVPAYYEDAACTQVLRVGESYPPVAAGQGKSDKATVKADANGIKLPDLTQWEYAARGGDPTNTTQWNYRYPGSDNALEIGWFKWLNNSDPGNSGEVVHPVKQKQENGAGLYDMCGNVAEWSWTRSSDDITSNPLQTGSSYYRGSTSFGLGGTVGNFGGSYGKDGIAEVGFRVICNP